MKYKRPDLSDKFCYAFPVSDSHPTPVPSPPQPPPPKPPCKKKEAIINFECCGNILIQENQVNSIELWSLDDNLNAFVTVSIYNSFNSTEPLIVEINSSNKHILHVIPGNTSSYTTQGIHSVKVITIGNSLTYIEGKYTIVGKILEKNKCN